MGDRRPVLPVGGDKRTRGLWKSLAAGVFLIWPSVAIAQGDPTVRISQVDGHVEIKKADSETNRPAREGEILDRGDRLVCGEKSAALLTWSNGSLVKVYGNSAVALAGVTFDLERKLETTFLDLEKGRVFVKAQVPDHIFLEFRLRTGSLTAIAQAAEFSADHDPEKKGLTSWVLVGRLVVEAANQLARVEEGSQAVVEAGTVPPPEAITPMSDKARQALARVSSEIGGSLLVEEEGGRIGGPLQVKIGGLRNRRGNAPYRVRVKAVVSGGSGKIRSIRWDFGDGESAATKEAEHVLTQGVYVIVLRIEDENGEKASAQVTVSVEESCAC